MITITPYDSDGNAVTSLYQWDRGITLTLISDYITDDISVHFANGKNGTAYPMDGTYSGGSLTVDVPDVLLQDPYPIYGYVYFESGDTGRTILIFEIEVVRRGQPSDIVAADTAAYVTLENVLAEVADYASAAESSATAAAASAAEAAEVATSLTEAYEYVTALIDADATEY